MIAYWLPIVIDTYMRKQYGAVRYGTVRYGTVRYGTVRYGTVRYGTVLVLGDRHVGGPRVNANPALHHHLENKRRPLT